MNAKVKCKRTREEAVQIIRQTEGGIYESILRINYRGRKMSQRRRRKYEKNEAVATEGREASHTRHRETRTALYYKILQRKYKKHAKCGILVSGRNE